MNALAPLPEEGRSETLSSLIDHPGAVLLDLLCGLPVSTDDRKLLALAVERWMFSGDKTTFDQALGWRRRGGVSFARRMMLDRRDALLHALWRSQWPDQAPAAAARLMVQSARAYRDRRWSRERNSISAPPDEPAATWWSIFQDGDLPNSRQLSRILERDIQYPV